MKKVALGITIGCCTIWGLTSARATGEQQPKIRANALKQDMRKLWSDHVIWTREYIIAAAADAADQQAAANRLMRNQDDIGNAVAPDSERNDGGALP